MKSYLNKLIPYIVAFTFFLACTAEAEDSGYFRLSNSDYWAGYLKDTGRIFTAPARWEKRNWASASLVVGVTAGLIAFDGELQDWVRDNKTDDTSDIASFVRPFGEIEYIAPPIIALYAYGHFADSERARRASLLSLESYALTGLFTQAMKFAFHRHRPRTGADPYEFDGPGTDADNGFLSFPSGHASSVWSVMTVYATEFDEYPIVPALCYGIATLTSLSRVHDDAHWASDAFFGSALGYFTAKAVIGYHNGKKPATLLPVISGDAVGLAVVKSF